MEQAQNRVSQTGNYAHMCYRCYIILPCCTYLLLHDSMLYHTIRYLVATTIIKHIIKNYLMYYWRFSRQDKATVKNCFARVRQLVPTAKYSDAQLQFIFS